MNVRYDLVLDDGSGVLEFEWDANKDAANRSKHGLGFDEAAAIFQGDVLTGEDDSAYGERRDTSLGLLGEPPGPTVVIWVLHTERNDRTRIISARKATAHERKQFSAYFQRTTH